MGGVQLDCDEQSAHMRSHETSDITKLPHPYVTQYRILSRAMFAKGVYNYWLLIKLHYPVCDPWCVTSDMILFSSPLGACVPSSTPRHETLIYLIITRLTGTINFICLVGQLYINLLCPPQ